MRRVPVIVLAGGLGSGKTTLLNHLLQQGVGRVGVVVNDFGDVNVDAFLVRGHVDATATISGGCLCCLADPDELDDTLAALARPALDLDVVLVEASGLAEPRELARLVMSSAVQGVRFGGVVQIVDAALWATAPGAGPSPHDLPMAADHLQVASLLVVNKVDRLTGDPAALDRLTADLDRHAPGTPRVRTSFGRIDPSLLFDAAERPAPTGQLSFTDLLLEDAADAEPHDHDHGRPDSHHDHPEDCPHPHHAWSSVSVSSSLGASPRALVQFLERRHPGIYRVKGRTYVDEASTRREYVVQAVGSWLAFERRKRRAGEEWGTELVAIGAGMDACAVENEIRACLTDGPLPADHVHAMARYTR